MATTIDAHVHFWQFDPLEYDWMDDDMEYIQEDFMPPDARQELEAHGMKGCVAVQARESEEENHFLIGLANKYSFIRGIIGWIDLQEDDAEEKLKRFSPNLVGLRHVIETEPDDKFLLGQDFKRGMGLLKKYKLTFDLYIAPRHLKYAIKFVNLYPEQKFMLDHLGKPDIVNKSIDDWRNNIKELAKHPLVYCKLSGMVTLANWDNWREKDFYDYLDVVFDAFGTDRLVFGSDWPMCKLAGEYGEVKSIIDNYIQDFPEEDKEKIMGLNAKRFYNLKI